MSLHFGAGKGPGHLDRFGGPSTVGPFQPDAVYGADFRQQNYKGPQVTNTNASGGYVDDSQGNWTFVPPNTLRRSDKGLLVEGQQTNSIRNNSMQGAVAGTPGTVPSFTSLVIPAGLTRTLSLENIQGIDVLRVLIQGTVTTAGAIQFRPESTNSASAAQNQLWSYSQFFQQLSVTGLSASGASWSQEVWEYDGSNALVSTGSATAIPFSTDASLVRRVISRTLTQTTTAFSSPILRTANIPVGTVVSAEFRIGWPQLEQWNTSVTTVGGASSPIRTTGTAATRNADTVTGALAGSLSTLTIAAVVQPIIPTINGNITRLGTSSDRVELRQSSTVANLALVPVVGGAAGTQATVVNAFSPSTRTAVSAAITTGDEAASAGGSTPATAAPASVPTVSTIQVGGGTAPFNGYIEKIQILPRRATNAELQQFSTLAA